MTHTTLYIGNKNYSSWSMRPWLTLRWGGVAFAEQTIPLQGEGWRQQKMPAIVAVSPTGRVPVLHHDGYVVADSMAICEWAAEQSASLWPAESSARAIARSAVAEMHSGFGALRRDLPMNLKRRMKTSPAWPADVQADLARLFDLWSGLRKRYAALGPFLMGPRTIADAFYAPVVSRLRTYAIGAPAICAAYCEAIEADTAYQEWGRAALAEGWVIPSTDEMYT